MKDLKKRLVAVLIVVIAFIAANANCRGQSTNVTYFTIIPGPVANVHNPDGSGTGWFPDDRFAAIGGGPDASINCLSWWMYRHEGASLDSSIQSANSEWIGGGPYGSGDYRGYWIESVFRPTDYGVSGSANLLLYTNGNASMGTDPTSQANLAAIGATITSVGTNPNTVPNTTGWPSSGLGTPYTITINSSYLIGFCHVEDYSSSGIANNDRTIYSFDNGLHWTKGPWVSYGGGSVVTTINGSGQYLSGGTPALVNISGRSVSYTTDLQTAATGQTTGTITGGGATSSGGLTYNRYLQQWVSFYRTSDAWPQVNAGVVASGDLQNWYKMGAYGGFIYQATGQGSVEDQQGDYPTIVGGYPTSAPNGPSLTMACGQLAWLYNNTGGLAGRAIGFIKVQQQDITWNGSINTDLDTTGNWATSPGFTGTFTGFADEQNSLTFGTSGSGTTTLINNIPSGTRLRGITYSSGAGPYTITGSTTPMSMEAYVINDTTGTYNSAVYGIHNSSNSVQEIDSPISVCTAALYLQTDNPGTIATGTTSLSGCVLNLTSPIDLRGSGGMVIVGPGVTVLSGGINDSGYTDFSSGTAEYIASCDEGRVVKEGTGTLVLSGTGTFSGRTDILGGVVELNSAYALENSVVSVSTGNAGSLVLNTNATFGGLNGTDNINLNGHTITIGNNTAQNNFPVNYTGTLSGAGSLIKTGNSSQALGGNNSYSGGTTLQGGILQIPAGASSLGTGALAFNGGTLCVNGAAVITNTITLSGSGVIETNDNVVTFDGVIGGSGSLISEGNSATPNEGTLVLDGDNTFTGELTVDNLVQISEGDSFGSGALALNGGTLQLLATVNTGGGAINVTGTGGTIDTQNFNLTSTGAIASVSGVPLTKLGTGTFSWSGNTAGFDGDLVVDSGTFCYTSPGTNTFSSGNITLNGSALTLAPTGSGTTEVLLASGAKAFTVNGSATLNLTRGSASSLTADIGTLTLGTSSLIINVPGGASTLGQSAGVTLLAGNLGETTSGQIFSPGVVVEDPVNGDNFVTYDTTKGFSSFTGELSESGTFSIASGSPQSAEVAEVTGNASLTAASYSQGLVIAGTNTLTTNYAYTMNGAGGQAGVILNNGRITGSGSLAFGSNHGIIFVGGSSATLSSTISGSDGVTIAGAPGTQVTLGTNNSFSGGLTIEGTKVCGSAEASFGEDGQVITLDGQGILDSMANLYRDITVNPGGGSVEVDSSAITLEYAIGGSGPLHKTGTGTLVLAGSYSSTGPIYVDQGVLQGNGGSLDSGSTGLVTVAAGATCTASESSGYNIPHNFLIGGTGTAGQGALVLSGGGNLTGNVTLSGNALIATTTGTTTAMIVAGTITGTAQNLQLTANAPLSVTGNLALGTGSLTLSGAGVTTLGTTFVGSQTGATIIATGSPVELNGTLSGTSGVTVNGILSGNGAAITTPGTVEVTGSGTIAPGALSSGTASTGGLIAVTGNLALDSGSLYQMYVGNAQGISSAQDTTSGYGTILDLGTGNLGGTLKIIYSGTYVPASGDVLWVMMRQAGTGSFSTVEACQAGSNTITGTLTTTTTGTVTTQTIMVNGVSGTLNYNDHNSLDISGEGSYDISISF